MKLIEITRYLVFIAEYSIAIPILIAIIFRAYRQKELKILFIGLCATFIVDIVTGLFFLSIKYATLYIFSAIEILTMTLMFSAALPKSPLSKTIRLIGFVMLPFIALDAFFWSGIDDNGYSITVVILMITAMAIHYLARLFKDTRTSNLTLEPLFWICIGLIINGAIGFFDVFSKPILTYSQNLYLQYYMIWSIAAIFMYSCFAYAFWLARRQYQG